MHTPSASKFTSFFTARQSRNRIRDSPKKCWCDENHEYALALHFMHYNFCRIHQTLRVTPAMEAGVTDRVWDVVDIVELVEVREAEKNRERVPHKKRNSN